MASEPEFGARIPKALYEEFKEYFPMYGSTRWFIVSSLQSFLETVRHSPDLKRQVAKSVEKMLQDNREGVS